MLIFVKNSLAFWDNLPKNSHYLPMLRLISDFDGPIMDVSERYYQVYLFCLKNSQGQESLQPLSKAELWEMKRSRVSEKQIALNSGLDEVQSQAFFRLRQQTVHTQPYFEYDQLKPGVVDVLTKIQQAEIDLVVMTMRRVRELDYAFKSYDLSRFFLEDRRYCLSNDYVKTRDVDDKPLLMERALSELSPVSDTWMVGDTEADIVAAQKHGIKVIAVECGIRSRQQLELFQPDLILKDLSAAVNFLLEK